MRTLIVLAGSAALAAVALRFPSLAPSLAPAADGLRGIRWPDAALFTFAVSAFREPLR